MPAGTLSSTLGQTMERRTRRCPAACSSPDFASWIAGFFSSVVCRTVWSVTALVRCAKQAIKIVIERPRRADVYLTLARCICCSRFPVGSAALIRLTRTRRVAHRATTAREPRSGGMLPRERNRCFIAGLVLQAGALHRQLALH